MAYAMPVLPDVASRMIVSRVSAPDFSPSWIIRSAGRSLTDPPGFFHSAFAYSSTLRRPASNVESRIKGVLPIRSMMEVAVRGSPGMATGMSDWESPDYRSRATETRRHEALKRCFSVFSVPPWPVPLLADRLSVGRDDVDRSDI